MRITIIGAGLSGLCAAYELSLGGAQVTVLERGPGPALETSYANGALLHPSFVDPWNTPGVLGVVLRSIGRPRSPMLLRLRALPSLITWGREFILQSTPVRFAANSVANLALAQFSLGCLADVRKATGIDYGSYKRGTLALFRSAAELNRGVARSERLAMYGLESRVLDASEATTIEPALSQVASELEGAIFFPNDEGGDAHLFCSELERHLDRLGVRFKYGITVDALVRSGTLIACAVDTAGVEHHGDAYLLAAASDSVLLAQRVGVRLPIRPVKGYSLTVRPPSSSAKPRVPITDMDLHMAVVPLADGRVRVAGTAEFCGFDRRIDPVRVQNLKMLLERVYPGLTSGSEPAISWAGLRPMSADGVPLIGTTGLKNLFLNTGHGQLGWTTAAGSARIVADVVLGRTSAIPNQRYGLARFDR